MPLPIPKNPYLALTYDSIPHADGIGAQAERIFAIYWFAHRIKISYMHSGITDLVEPYTNTWNSREYKERLILEVNNKILLPSTINWESDDVRVYRKLTRRIILFSWLESLVTQKRILLKVLYVPRIRLNERYLNAPQQAKDTLKTIIVHIRNSEGRFGIYDRRNLEIDYYLELLGYLKKQLEKTKTPYAIKIFTDIPKIDFELIISQIPEDKLWIYSLTEEQLQFPVLHFKGKDYKKLYFEGEDNVSVVHGGNALEALDSMERADYLILSRSSLSSIAAILNKNGMVIQPPDWIYFKNTRYVRARSLIRIKKEWRVARHPLLYILVPHSIMNSLKRAKDKIVKYIASRKSASNRKTSLN